MNIHPLAAPAPSSPAIRNGHRHVRRTGSGLLLAGLLGLAALPAQAATFAPVTETDLAAAIVSAGNSPEDDTIDLGGNTITLTDGLPTIESLIAPTSSGKLTLRNGTLQRTLGDEIPRFRILSVGPGAVVDLERLTLTGGFNNDEGGGALWNRGGAVRVIASTLSGNNGFIGGAILNGPFQGDNIGSSLTVISSTLSGNAASAGGAIYNQESLTITASTITGNVARTQISAIANQGNTTATRSVITGECRATGGGNGLISGGYNVTTGGCLGSTVSTDVNADPLLGPLANNGGPTQTHALLAGSPALDLAPNGDCAGTTDQRGIARPQGAGCDSGAFEVAVGPTYLGSIQQPINADGSSTFNSKKGVVPVKFTLKADGVATCSLPAATIRVTRTAGGVIGAIDEADYLQASDSGANFRITDCQYQYNVNAKSFGTGKYTVELLIGGASKGTGIFELK